MGFTDEDIEYVKFCAKNEADKTYDALDELLTTLRLLHLEHNSKYKTLSAARTELSIIVRYGLEVFETNASEDNEKDWWK